MNRVILIGRLTRDPELRYTQNNKAVATFTLAVNRNMSKEKREEAESNNRPTANFPRITVWNVQAENAAKYLKKGSQCAVIGSIQTGSYVDKETGKTVYTTDVLADNIEFLGKSSDNQEGGQNQGSNNNYNNNQANNYNQGAPQNAPDDDFFEDDFTEIEDDGRIPF